MAEAPAVRNGVPLSGFTTLRAGGNAERFATAKSADELAELAQLGFHHGWQVSVLAGGSNTLPSDDGVPGLVVLNRAAAIKIARSGEVLAESGAMLQEVWLKSAQSCLCGLSYAVGIPGSVGGALASNAGAYRNNISDHLVRLEVVWSGVRRWVEPSELGFSYRDSILRRVPAPPLVVLRVEMKLAPGDPQAIFDDAREFQRQRISKQPAPASAGSFFKNVVNAKLAADLPGLPDGLRKAGVVPAGFLVEAAGLKGFRLGGAMLGTKHANFILNVGGATATEIRRLAEHTKAVVLTKFGVTLEEEVLYLGDWSRFTRAA